MLVTTTMFIRRVLTNITAVFGITYRLLPTPFSPNQRLLIYSVARLPSIPNRSVATTDQVLPRLPTLPVYDCITLASPRAFGRTCLCSCCVPG